MNFARRLRTIEARFRPQHICSCGYNLHVDGQQLSVSDDGDLILGAVVPDACPHRRGKTMLVLDELSVDDWNRWAAQVLSRPG